jgi:hypothetical protein
LILRTKLLEVGIQRSVQGRCKRVMHDVGFSFPRYARITWQLRAVPTFIRWKSANSSRLLCLYVLFATSSTCNNSRARQPVYEQLIALTLSIATFSNQPPLTAIRTRSCSSRIAAATHSIAFNRALLHQSCLEHDNTT